jgi:hypothetical protein
MAPFLVGQGLSGWLPEEAMMRGRVHRTARRGLLRAADLQEQSSSPVRGRLYCGARPPVFTTALMSVVCCREKAWRARAPYGVTQQGHNYLYISTELTRLTLSVLA